VKLRKNIRKAKVVPADWNPKQSATQNCKKLGVWKNINKKITQMTNACLQESHEVRG